MSQNKIFLVTNRTELPFESLNTNIITISIKESLKLLSQYDVLGIDTETTGLDEHSDKLIMLQLGNYNTQFVIDLTTIDIKHYIPILTNPDITFIGQNLAFDLRFLLKKGIILNMDKLYDTFVAENCIYRGHPPYYRRKGLDSLVYNYLGINLPKEVRQNIHLKGLTYEVIEYAANDVKYLESIREKQQEDIIRLNIENYVALENKFVLPLAYTMFCGFKLNRDKWREKCERDVIKLEEQRKVLDTYVITNYPDSPFIQAQLDLFDNEFKTNILWSSSQQVIKLFKYLGIDVSVTKKGITKDSVDQKHLNKIKDSHPIIPLYMEYSKLAKVVSTYGYSFIGYINKRTGRIHTHYTQIMDTGRLSSGKKDSRNPKYSKPNLQNIPSNEEHRSCFEAEKGNILEVGDYSGQEQIVLVNKSMEPNLLKFYDDGHNDMHSYIASMIFPHLNGVPLPVIKKEYAEDRQTAKIAGFALNYGGTDYTLINEQGIPEDIAKNVYKSYFSAFSKLDNYYNTVKKEALSKGYIRVNNISNSLTHIPKYLDYVELEKNIKIPGFWDTYREEKDKQSDTFIYELRPLVREYFSIKGEIERNAMNFPIQGTSAEITKLAVIYLFRYLIENELVFKVLINNLVHDEIVIEYSEELVIDMDGVLKKCMEEAGEVFCKRILLKAEPMLTKTWKH